MLNPLFMIHECHIKMGCETIYILIIMTELFHRFLNIHPLQLHKICDILMQIYIHTNNVFGITLQAVML